MLTTFNRTDWKEDSGDEWKRDHLTAAMPQEELRRLFPYKARIIKTCPVYKLTEGQEVEFARTTQVVKYFPIECVIEATSDPRRIMLNSDEAEVMEA